MSPSRTSRQSKNAFCTCTLSYTPSVGIIEPDGMKNVSNA
jgi:hypothetical protein